MDSIVLESERHLRVGANEARATIIHSLRTQEFSYISEQISMITAHRGSQLLGAVQEQKLPVMLNATFRPTSSGCAVKVRLADAWHSGIGKVWGMNGQYRTLLGEIQTEIDDALEPIAGDIEFDRATVTLDTRDVPGLSIANAAIARAGEAVVEKTDELLTPARGVTSRSLDALLLRSSKGIAAFGRLDVEGLLTVGMLVSTRKGASASPGLALDVDRLSTRIEMAIAAQPSGRVTLALQDTEVPVAEFLDEQASIRQQLPLRTLHVCTTCKFEQIVNPDCEKLQERNRRKGVIKSTVGATVSKGGISPFLIIGSVMKLKNFDIPFVCPRCQGLDADSSVVTYCPQCGERRDETVLTTCPKCDHDFAGSVAEEVAAMWQQEAAPAVDVTSPLLRPVQPLPAPAIVPAPPKQFLSPPVIRPIPEHNPQPVRAQTLVTDPTISIERSRSSGERPLAPAAWYRDPASRHEYRYWDGKRWTADVADRGVPSDDPL
jgi:hypothetical protein